MSSEGFLSRWSRRKAGVALEEEQLAAPDAALPAEPPPPEPPVDAPPPPTMDDVAQLTRDSDFSRFVAPNVDDGVKRAAMKKLFTDPHFNVMDGLDTYIDDYGQPDPIPESMLRRMAQAQVLGLFDDEAKPEPKADEDPDLRLQQDDAAGPAGPDEGAGA
ncbi:MAG TPA: DUF3306 domain-containing protein [Albitalea sp.]|nr:DUF3306 domain-containing protein [Albitalea sp.]